MSPLRVRIPRRRDLWPPLWRRRPVVGAIVVLVLLAAAAARLNLPAGGDHDRYHNRLFRCVHVVDGDTIDIDAPDGRRSTTRIRLWGVDTPETENSPQGAMYFGSEASAFARSCVADATVRVVLAQDQTRDRYGRILAYVWFGDPPRMLNEEIVAGGYGYADTRFDHAFKKRFMDLEDRARRARAGLWADVRPDQMPPWRQRAEEWRQKESSGAAR